MSLAKRNAAMLICFLFALSVILSFFVLIQFDAHQHICEDAACRICSLVHSAGGVFGTVKLAVICIILLLCTSLVGEYSELPLPSPAQLTPVSKKTKQLN